MSQSDPTAAGGSSASSKDSLPTFIEDMNIRQQPITFSRSELDDLAEPTDTPGIAAVPLSKLSKKAPKSVKAPLSAKAALENNTRMIGALMEFIQKTMTKNAATFPIARTSKNQKFDSKNATTFIKRFEGLLKDYKPEADGDRKAELFDFMVSTDPVPTLLGRPWARKTRLHSRNCDNGT
jgi:hypothetical protein